ncbi:DUF6166 domain-containing protein [Halorubrum sp. PV6]|uniref:DUF6166 domain-containing protein n=1 Tax=Halorubrum sp. PV6 TaxID=634157 RepID=UPI001304B4BD|nr:DUF6166 domain-containing protein [Halorubrum sp. PV6]
MFRGSLNRLNHRTVDIFILKKEHEGMNVNHPIDKEILKNTLRQHSANIVEDPDLGIETEFLEKLTLVNDDLKNAQNTLQANLKYILGCATTGTDDIHLLWQSSNYIIFDDREGILIEGLSDKIDFVSDLSLIHKMHSRMANEIFRNFTERPSREGDTWIIKVPQDWAHATQFMGTLLTELIKKGVTPTQALDYWLVEIHNKTVPNWATERQTSTQAIRKNIEKATERLNEDGSSLEYDSDHYFNSVYDGRYTTENRRVVTVNGHHLDPQTDLYDYSPSGSLSWGYRGAGPTQLAAAMLCDVFGADQVDHDMIVSFRRFCNKKMGQGGHWRIDEDEIFEWYDDYTEHDSS